MGLMAWYPFNGDYKNYGLGDLDLSVITTPAFSTGKTGQGLTTGAFTWTATQAASVFNNNEISICFWLYVNAETGSTTKRAMLFGHEGGMSTTYNNRKFSLFQYPSCNDFHWSWQNDDASTTFTAGSLTGVLPSYKWTHVAITYKNPTGKIYINGVLKHTFTGVSNSSTFAHATEVIHNNSYRTVCDFRVYNNELSAMEVKKISQGLILHYPLSGIGGENLLVNSDFMLSATSSVAASASGLSVTVPSEYFPLLIGKTVTFSFYYSCIGERVNDPNYSYGNRFGMHGTLQYVNTSGTSVTTYPLTNYLIMSGTGRAVQTYTMPSDCAKITSFSVAVQPLAKPAATNSAIWWLARPKLEIGTKATPWCPNKNDTLYSQLGLNDGIEYDTSGFKNNGSFTSGYEPFKSGNSPRYSGSYHFQSKFMNLANIPYENMMHGTMSFWINIHSYLSWDHIVFIANTFNWTGNGSDFVLMARNSSSSNFFNLAVCSYNTNYTPTLNKWLHVAITWDRTTYQIKIYFDGKLYKTIDDSTNKRLDTYTSSHNIHAIGNHWASDSYKGDFSMSDFRVYATALSASDISDLYNNVGSIDKNGNFYAYEFIEEDTKWT